mgnify:CR=1 FL=1
MVKVCIIPKSNKQSDEIVEFLLRGKHILTALVKENMMVTKLNEKDQTVKSKKTAITGIIRSLHFNNLNEKLKEIYKEEMPVLYSVPIIHMDPDQADAIMEYTTAF